MPNDVNIKVRVRLKNGPQHLLEGTVFPETGIPKLLLECNTYPQFTQPSEVSELFFAEEIAYPGPQWSLRCDAIRSGFPFPRAASEESYNPAEEETSKFSDLEAARIVRSALQASGSDALEATAIASFAAPNNAKELLDDLIDGKHLPK